MPYEEMPQDEAQDSDGKAGRQTGRIWQLGRRRHALAACVVAGACIAMMGWASRKSAVLFRFQGPSSHLLGLASPAEIASLPYVDDSKGQKIAKRSDDMAKCIGEVFSAAFQLADVSVTAMQAVDDCLYTKRNARKLSAAQTPGGFPTNQTVGSVEGLLEILKQTANSLPAQARSALTIPDEDIYGARREKQTLCVRDVGFLLRSSLGSAALLVQATPNCAQQDHGTKGRCAQQVLLSVRASSVLSALIARMVHDCRPQFDKYATCSGLLESLSWVVAGAARVYSNSIYECAQLDPQRRVKKSYAINFATGCIGPIFSIMGYLSASGVNFAAAKNYDCLQKRYYKDLEATTGLTPEQTIELRQFQATCAKVALSGVRQILLAAWRVVTTAGFCTRSSYPCQADTARGASALVGTGQGIAQVAEKCYNIPSQVTLTEDEKKTYMVECAEKTGALVKILSVTVAYGVEAASSCVEPKYAGVRCAASVWRAIAALGALQQQFATVYNKCKLNVDWYSCGGTQRVSGLSFRIFVLGFSGALLNCPLNPLRQEWDATGRFSFPSAYSYP